MKHQTKTSRSLGRFATATALSTSLLAAATSAVHADEALADLVERVSPSVVTVLSSREPAQMDLAKGPTDGMPFPEGSPFEDFFKNFGPQQGIPDQFRNPQPSSGLGSGFILDAEGWIVTNHHVVDGADTVTVRLSDDREFDAEIIGVDEQTDLALLRIEANDALPFVELGDSSEIRVGEDVMAVGNPFGLGGTVTKGIISAKGRNIAVGPYADFLQTDAAINRGNSGGPLFNMDGEVVGVNSAIYSPTGGSVGVGFAVASDIVEMVVEDLKDDGKVDRGWLGVSIQNVTPDLAAALGLENAKGALVSSVVAGSPSDGALETGDVILTFDGQDVPNSNDLPKLVAAAGIGETVEVVVLRSGNTKTLDISLGQFTAAQNAQRDVAEPEETSALEAMGATVAELTDSARAEIGVGEDTQGLVITSLSSS
ncbi:MAG: Do family serine endopeptidase, partial [Dinoroseobacter sp.]|nr:Do family serine endopeptidase [Dinoroseobacter sp.]